MNSNTNGGKTMNSNTNGEKMNTNTKDTLSKLLKGTSLLILLGVLACIILVCVILSQCVGCSDSDEDGIEYTADDIIKMMPKNEMYVATAMIEDFTTLQKTGHRFLVIPEEHSCVQILRQKVSYKIDLDDVKYEELDDHIMEVTIPEPEYIASTQASPFISDDEEYWKDELESTDELKDKVAAQIKAKFDTTKNKRKAVQYAEEAIENILEQVGYEARFVSKVEQNKD